MSVVNIHNAADARATILARKPWEDQEMPPQVLDGIERIFGERLAPAEAVARILADVRQNGDAALQEWSARIDRTEPAESPGQPRTRQPGRLEIPAAEWQAAYARLPEAERRA